METPEQPNKNNNEEARLHSRLMVLQSKDSKPEETQRVIEVIEEMERDPKLREYIDERLPDYLVEEYTSWALTVNQTSDDVRDELTQEESEEAMRDRMSMSEKQIELLFGYVGKRDSQIKTKFEELFGPIVGPEDETRESGVKSLAWREYRNFRDIADYMYGKASDTIQSEINDRLISDEQFRDFIDKIKKALKK